MGERTDGTLGLPLPGQVLNGKYRLSRKVGEGGMGVVFEAIHLRLRKRVALKFLHPSMVADPDAVRRFEREARNASRLTSLHATRIFDVDHTAAGVPFIVSELLRGHSLQRELSLRRKLPIVEAVDYLLQACISMKEAHAIGIVHRDLKPSNLFLCDAGELRVLKVLDFGISKVATTAADAELTTTGMILGTPRYAAPEQLVDVRTVDRRADIWSLGVILYRALTGAYPFVGETQAALVVAVVTWPPTPFRDHREDVPDELIAVIEKALAKAPADRYQTVEELARALEPFGSGELPSAEAVAGILMKESDPPPDPPEVEASNDLEVSLENTINHPALVPVEMSSPPRAAKAPWVIAGGGVLLALAAIGFIALAGSSRRAVPMIAQPPEVAQILSAAPAAPTSEVPAALPAPAPEPSTRSSARTINPRPPARPRTGPAPATTTTVSSPHAPAVPNKPVDPAFL
jgi:serine/threonine-protein kinase